MHLVSDGQVHSGWSVGLNVQGNINANPGRWPGDRPLGNRQLMSEVH